MAKQTQCEKILAYISDFGSITTRDAFLDLADCRLASRINELKRMGYKIESTVESGKNRYGEPVHYKRYTIKKEIESNVIQ
jgi:hypothetical protein